MEPLKNKYFEKMRIPWIKLFFIKYLLSTFKFARHLREKN